MVVEGVGAVIEYLEQLVAERRWAEAVKLGEQLLNDSGNSPEATLRIQSALVIAKGMMRDYPGSLFLGEAAVSLAQRLGDWDKFGEICLNVGATSWHMGELGKSEHFLLQFVAHQPMIANHSRWEAAIWYNLGKVYTSRGEGEQAARAFDRAVSEAVRHGDLRYAHGVRQALIEAFLKIGDLRRVPRLLAQSGAYLRSNPEAESARTSRLFFLRLRVEYCLSTGRLQRALAVSLRGLAESEGEHRHLHDFHMLLARGFYKMGSCAEALGHCLSARACAVACNRHDLESMAMDCAFEILRLHPETAQAVERLFQLEPT